MRVESDRLDGKPSRKQGQQLPLQRRGSLHERLVVRAFECQEIDSPPQDHRQGEIGWRS